jgi:hypothetical protein
LNSLDAILALLVLMVVFGVFLAVLVGEKQKLDASEEIITLKVIASKCAVIVDGIFSNSGSGFEEQLSCFGNEKKVFAKSGIKQKEVSVIAIVEKKSGLEVRTNDHYT